jgi:hypothetical protein
MACEDLKKGVTEGEIVQFADDITLVVAGKTEEEVVERANRGMAQFAEYAGGNRLAAEPAKTQVMICTGAKRRAKFKAGQFIMEGKKLTEIGGGQGGEGNEEEIPTHMKILGCYLEEVISGEIQAAMMAGKANGALWNVVRSTKFVHWRDREMLVQALVHPLLDYCQDAFPVQTQLATRMAEQVYKRSARVTARTARTAPALKKLNWPSWKKRRGAARLALVMKIWTEGAPEALKALFPEAVKRQMAIRRVQNEELEEPRARTAEGTKAFRHWAPRVYNREKNGGQAWSGSDEESDSTGG